MRNLFRAACLFSVIVLASCRGDSSGDSPTTGGAPTAARVQQSVVLTTDSTGLVKTVSSKGMAVQLDGRFENAVIARRNPDGTITTECHDDQAAAEAFVQGAPSPHSQIEVR
ncbi:MAG TPA: hypothetical protein VN253_27295 [Kofleriaceae bacterium]|nr:hypothetical protein [Kofleriaceae bacterium]